MPNPLLDVEVARRRITRCFDQIDDILLDLRIHVDGVGELSQANHVRGRKYGGDLMLNCRAGHSTQDFQFVLALWVGHSQLQHEAVHLGLRQGIGALLLDWILGREDQERILERIGLGPDRHLPLLHCLQ